ncbi:MAG: O-antigen ligase family protein [Planctomycetes bacterium]|nr:O-antigen ligase family protein [Planctomycetota bacterium]
MRHRRMTGWLLVIVLIVIALAYLPPREEKDWLSNKGLPFVRAFPSTLHVTYPKVVLFRGMSVALGVILLVRIIRDKRVLAATAEEVLLIAFLLLCAASILWADWPWGWFCRLAPLFFAVLWAEGLGRLAARDRCETFMMKGIVAAGLATAVFGLIGFFGVWAWNPDLIHDATFRLAVPHRSNSNFTACILITPMLMAWSGGVAGGGRKIVWIPFALLLTVAIALTRSASGLVGIVVGTFALGVLTAPKNWRRYIVAIPISLLGAAGMVMVSVPGLTARGVDFCLQGTRAVRYFFWQDAFRMILCKPVLGWGGGGFFFAYPRFRQAEEFLYPQLRKIIGDHAHNELLNIGVELGGIGMAVACALAVLLIWRASRGIGQGPERWWQRALLAGTIGMLAQSCFSPLLRSWDVAPFFWTQIGLLMALARGGEGKEPKWVKCGTACRILCAAILLLSAAGFVTTGWRGWKGETLLAKGMAFDVRRAEDARAADPYLERGAALVMDPVWWYNAKFRHAVCLRREGRINEAIHVIEEIDGDVPNLGAARLYLGELYFSRFRERRVVTDQAAALANVNSYLSANADAGGYLLAARVLLAGRPRPETVIHYLETCLALRPSRRQKAEAERLLTEIRGATPPK